LIEDRIRNASKLRGGMSFKNQIEYVSKVPKNHILLKSNSAECEELPH